MTEVTSWTAQLALDSSLNLKPGGDLEVIVGKYKSSGPNFDHGERNGKRPA